jgi:hypothetical protein
MRWVAAADGHRLDPTLAHGQSAGGAALFVVWQVINFVVFRSIPSVPILVGGALIVAGGLLVTYWRPGG